MSPTGAVPIQKPGDGVQLSSSLVSEDDKNIHTTKESEDAVVSGMNYSVDDNLLEITNRNGTARNDQVCLVKVAIRKSDDAMKVADESKKTEVSDRNCADLEGFRSKPIGHADHDADKACEVVIPSKPVYSDCSTTAECTDASNRRAHNGVISMIETEADAKSGAAAVECGNVLTECCTSVNANDQHCSGEISNTVEWLINLAANCQDSSDSVEKDDGSHGSSFSKCHRVTMSAVVEKINGPAHVVTSAAMPSSSSTLGEAVCLRTEEETDRTLQKSAERTADSLTCKAEKGIHEVLPSSSKPSCLSPSTSFRKRSPCRLGAKRHHPIDDEGGPSRTYSRHTEACKEGVSQLKNDSDIMHKSSNGIVGESSGRNSVNDSALSDEDDDEEEEEEDFLNAYAVYGRPPRSMRASMLVERMWQQGFTPRQILSELLPRAVISADIEDADIIQIINGIIDNDRPARFTLHHYCKFGDAVQLFKERKHILILSGAGISVSCGIPDFRSRDGIYARLRVEYPDLPEPSSMFDINYFNQNPRPFFEFAKEIFPGSFEPSICHYFIKTLESEGKLLRNYTQNIDTLEHVAGITKIVQCHGSFATATCRNCGVRVNGEVIRDDVSSKRIAMCQECCDPQGILKPDIVFFGEDLPEEFHECFFEDKSKVDLIVVIGSSLKVHPVAQIPFTVDHRVPQILINRETLDNYIADIELLGDCDDIVVQLALALGQPYTDILSRATVPKIVRKEKDIQSIMAILEPEAVDVEKAEVTKLAINDATSDMHATHIEKSDRFVKLTSLLSEDSFLFIEPNKSIFPGAEAVYDRETHRFMDKCYTSPDLNGTNHENTSEGNGGNLCDENELERTTSEDDEGESSPGGSCISHVDDSA